MPAKTMRPLRTGPKRTTADAVREAELRSGKASRVVSITDLSALTGYDRGTISRWIEKGLPVEGKGTKGAVLIDVRTLIEWREEQAAVEERRKLPGSTEDPSVDPDTEFKREQTKFQKIKTAERVGLLVPVSTVVLIVGMVLNAFRTAIDSLPDRIERDLVDFPPELARKAKTDVRDHCRAALRQAQKSLEQGIRRLTRERLSDIGADPDDLFDAEDEEDTLIPDEGDDDGE